MSRRSHVLQLNVHKNQSAQAILPLVSRLLIHLSFMRINAAISNFKRMGAEYLLSTSHTSVVENVDCPDGSWRSVNLQLPPFDFPEPLKLIVEDEELGKCLGVWRLKDL